MSTLYTDMVATGEVIDHHESDLYVRDTPATRAVLARHPDQRFSTFKHVGTGERWLDITFAYAPWWEARQR